MAPIAAQQARESEAPLAVIFAYVSPSALIGAHGLLSVVGNARDCAARKYTSLPVGRDRVDVCGICQFRFFTPQQRAVRTVLSQEGTRIDRIATSRLTKLCSYHKDVPQTVG